MAWTHARDRIATIIEGTTPTTFAAGLPQTFSHFQEAVPDVPPPARCFWLGFASIAMRGRMGVVGPRIAMLAKPSQKQRAGGPTTPILPRHIRVPIDIFIAYPMLPDLTLLYEVLAADWLAIMTRLLNVSLWEQATSTIESLSLGSELVGQADVDFADDDAGVLLTIHSTAEFTA